MNKMGSKLTVGQLFIMAVIRKIKLFNFMKNYMKSRLKDTLERAKTYLSIIESIERIGKFSREQENWLLKNCRLLQDEMNELKFRQIEVSMQDGYGRMWGTIKDLISVFPTYLETSFPMDKRFIYSALNSNLNGYIQKVEDLIKNPKKLKELSKEKKKKALRIIKFDKIKLIEIIFVGLFITSVVLLINPNTFIYGFILNIISFVSILILSFINWEEL